MSDDRPRDPNKEFTVSSQNAEEQKRRTQIEALREEQNRRDLKQMMADRDKRQEQENEKRRKREEDFVKDELEKKGAKANKDFKPSWGHSPTPKEIENALRASYRQQNATRLAEEQKRQQAELDRANKAIDREIKERQERERVNDAARRKPSGSERDWLKAAVERQKGEDRPDSTKTREWKRDMAENKREITEPRLKPFWDRAQDRGRER